MMMQMLAAGGLPVMTDDVRIADDDNLQGYYELEAVKQTRRDQSWLQEAPGKAVKVIYRLLGELPTEYDYRVLFMLRPLEEVVASQQVMLERRGTKGANVSRDQLQKIFVNELQQVKSWLAAQVNFDSIEIQYTDVLANAQCEAERICRFLALPLDAEAMAAQVNRKLYRQQS